MQSTNPVTLITNKDTMKFHQAQLVSCSINASLLELLIHGKFLLQRNFKYFTESRFTLVLKCEIAFMTNSRHFGDFTWNPAKICQFFTQNHKNRENCNSRISRFPQMMKHEITFKLDSRKFWSQPITTVVCTVFPTLTFGIDKTI